MGNLSLYKGSGLSVVIPNVSNQVELQLALDTYGSANIPAGADFLVDNLIMPAGSTISGNGTLRYNTDNLATYSINVNSNCSITGIVFKRLQSTTALSAAKLILYTYTNADNVAYDNLRFVGELTAANKAFETFIFFEQHCTNMKVTRCNTLYGAFPIFGIDSKGGAFTNNYIKFPCSCGFKFFGCKYNKIIGNTVEGRNIHGTLSVPTVTDQSTSAGINFLTFGFLGFNRGIVGNQIIGNLITGISEEGIGLDTHGSVGSDTAENQVLPVATVFSVAQSGSRQVITLQESTTTDSIAAGAGWAYQAYVIVLNGTAAGFMAPIIDSTASGSVNTATIVIPANIGTLGASSGDRIQITYGVIDNIVADNIVNETTTGISFWGSSWNNKVINNTIDAIDVGISIASVVGGVVTPNVGNKTLSYSGLNTVSGNTIKLNFAYQGTSTTRGVTPLLLGAWCYGAPTSTIPFNIGTDILNNNMVSAKNVYIGGLIPSALDPGAILQDPGASSVYGGRIAGNRITGGGVMAFNKTNLCFTGPNYKTTTREDFNAGASANNTTLTSAA